MDEKVKKIIIDLSNLEANDSPLLISTNKLLKPGEELIGEGWKGNSVEIEWVDIISNSIKNEAKRKIITIMTNSTKIHKMETIQKIKIMKN